MKPADLDKLIADLIREHGAALRLFASAWTGSPDDCVQQALIKLIRQPTMPQNPVTWLYAVVRNEAISMSRSATRRRKRETAVARSESLFKDQDDAEFNAEELNRALTQLESDLREIVVAKIWGELTYEEIGALVGCSSSSAHRRFDRGLTQLKNILDSQNPLKESHEFSKSQPRQS